MKYNQIPQYNAPHKYRGGFRCGCRGRGGFGRGRGPVVCHNCQQPGNYARDCPLPLVTCMYYCTTNHETKDFPTLLGEIQEKRNQNNQNVQWIFPEFRDDGKNINIVTRGEDNMGVDTTKKDPTQH
jgi:hypothetical protein